MNGQKLVRLRTLIADPDWRSRDALCALLQCDPRFALLGVVGADPCGAVVRKAPDLLVLDPTRDGTLDLFLLRDLAGVAPATRIVLYSAVFTVESFFSAMLLGATGYLLKRSLPDPALCDALELSGRTGYLVIDPLIATAVRAHAIGRRLLAAPAAAPVLEERALCVLRALAGGQNRATIAALLGLSVRTVQRTIDVLHAKLGTTTPFQLGAAASRQGLL